MIGVDRNELVEAWLREERQPFSGWDFSFLDGRIRGEREPWSYLDRAAELMGCSSSVIDLDTGGGEKFLRLREHWPARVVATEDYAPNFKLASERLSPHGGEVLKVGVSDTGPMPFADGEFDLVLNRHADFNRSSAGADLVGVLEGFAGGEFADVFMVAGYVVLDAVEVGPCEGA